ncbi:MAG: DUF1343 domain-containing protein [Saprospiraceae bacterium]
MKAKIVLPGAYNLPKYFSKLENRKIGLVIHPCSVIDQTYLLDTLLSLKINIQKIFVPEHGFRGNNDAGVSVENVMDEKTGIQIISLYGKHKKPSKEDLENIDLIVFDLQDVGVRFYTYLSTLHYVMESCAEYNKELLILDRPNPNGYYVDGPVLEDDCKSFVGIHPIPIVYGLTIGEMSQMIKGEQWISMANELRLTVIPCQNYSHLSHYELPIKPSPNLPNLRSILLYPSMCFFEGTIVSLGRGTKAPFQLYGHPDFMQYDTVFTPLSIIGAKNPPFLNIECKGYSLSNSNLDSIYKQKKINLNYLISAFKNLKGRSDFFLSNNFIDLLAGTKEFRKQIQLNWTEEEIRKEWKPNIIKFKILRKKYLIYPDFE